MLLLVSCCMFCLIHLKIGGGLSRVTGEHGHEEHHGEARHCLAGRAGSGSNLSSRECSGRAPQEYEHTYYALNVGYLTYTTVIKC